MEKPVEPSSPSTVPGARAAVVLSTGVTALGAIGAIAWRARPAELQFGRQEAA